MGDARGTQFNPVALALDVLADRAGEDRTLDDLRSRLEVLDDARNRIVDSALRQLLSRAGGGGRNGHSRARTWPAQAAVVMWVAEYHHGVNDSIQKFSNIVLHVTGTCGPAAVAVRRRPALIRRFGRCSTQLRIPQPPRSR